jgi:hypothetical protein
MAARALKLICTGSKQGDSLRQISELSGFTVDQVKEKLGQATGLTPEELTIIFNLKEGGLSLEQISQEFEVELEILNRFLADTPKRTQDILEGFETQIDALADQCKRPFEISKILGVTEQAVLAYLLGSPDDCQTYITEASELAPIIEFTRRLPTITEEMKESESEFIYSYEWDTDRLHRTDVKTGEQSCHRVPKYKFKSRCCWSELPGATLLITGTLRQ